MPKTLVRTNLMLPKNVLEEIDRRTGNRSEYVRRILDENLKSDDTDLKRRLALFDSVRGVWKNSKLFDRSILRKIRAKDRTRTRQLLKYATSKKVSR